LSERLRLRSSVSGKIRREEIEMSNVRPEIQALIARGNVTSVELAELRCNSWEWESLVPAMTDEAFIEHVEHALKNCSRPKDPSTSYESTVFAVHAPELVRRFKKLTQEADLLADTVGDLLVPELPEPSKLGRSSWVEIYDKWMAENRDAYAGKNVALKGGEVIDSDESRSALQARIACRPDIRELMVVQVFPRGVKPGEHLKLQDPRFGTPEHMKARWRASGIRGPFFVVVENGVWCVCECNGQDVVARCATSEIADAVFDALHEYMGEMARIL